MLQKKKKTIGHISEIQHHGHCKYWQIHRQVPIQKRSVTAWKLENTTLFACKLIKTCQFDPKNCVKPPNHLVSCHLEKVFAIFECNMYQAVCRWSVGESKAETSPPETFSEKKIKHHSLLLNLRIKFIAQMFVSNTVLPPQIMEQSYLHSITSNFTLHSFSRWWCSSNNYTSVSSHSMCNEQ